MLTCMIWRNKILLIFIIIAFMFSTACTTYRNMRPTGVYTTLSRKKEKDLYTFLLIQMPEPKQPLLILRFGKYPIYEEKRNIKNEGEKKTYYAFAFLGLIGLLYDFAKPWKQTSKYTKKTFYVNSEDEFKPLANIRIKVSFPSISSIERELVTDAEGQVILNVSEIAPLVRDGSSLKLTFESLETAKASDSFTIPSTFFAALKKYYASIRPPNLKTRLSFDDSNSWTKNQMIDGAEKSYLVAMIENHGEGQALDAKLRINNSNPGVSINVILNLGTIAPGSKVKKRIPIIADMELADGSVTFNVQTKEQRGYNARPVQLQISTRHLDKPKFELINLEVNDGSSGLASGNGNGIPENGETVELKAYLKNIGAGKAYDAVYELIDLPSEIKILQKIEKAGTILPGESRVSKVVFKIPLTYTSKTIPLRLKISDALQADVLERQETLSMGVNLPILAYQLEKPGIMHNGQKVEIRLSTQNTGKLTAKNVEVRVDSRDLVMLSSNYFKLSSIAPGATAQPHKFTVTIPRTYRKNIVSLTIKMEQSDFEDLMSAETLPLEIWKPELQISARMLDANQNNLIEQGERIEITATVTNQGKLAAENVRLMLQAPDKRVINVNEKLLGTIQPQSSERHTFVLNIPWDSNLIGDFPITLLAEQEDFSSEQSVLPYEVVSGEAIVQKIEGQIQPASPQPFSASATGQNTPPTIFAVNLKAGDLIAESQYPVRINFSDDRQITQAQARLNGLLVFNSQNDPASQEQLRRSEGRSLSIEKTLRSLKRGENILEVTAVDNANEITSQSIRFQHIPGIQVAGNVVLNPSIDIESNIPHTPTTNPDAIAVILGVERYKDIPSVTYARRDAAVFREYAVHVLGVPDDANHIYFRSDEDVTLSEFRILFTKGGWLENQVNANSDVYVYYAGHGAPDIQQKIPFLIPYDGNANYAPQTGFSLNQLYQNLAHLNAHSITVFLDACFSGLTRDNELLLADARPAAISIENPALLSPKMTAFMSSGGNQISNGYPHVKHGLFTYFLLKGLKGEADKNGDKAITVSELENYLVSNVKNTSGAFGSVREQEPQVWSRDKNRVLVRY